MSQRTKLYLLTGDAIFNVVYAATYPIIAIYFVSLIDSSILALANIINTALAAGVNASIQADKIMNFYRRNFLWIIVIDVICFTFISYEGLAIPEARFLGLAVLNSVSTVMWFAVIRDSINHRINGTELTKWDSLSKSVNLAAASTGSVIAIIFTGMSVEACIIAQCIANLSMGIADWIAYQRISY